MKSDYWFDTEEDMDRKRRRQSEFLVHKEVPIDVLLGFAVKNDKVRQKVNDLLHKYNYSKPVGIRDWYY